MIAFVGDIHGNFRALANILYQVEQHPEITAVIQVGDFGFYPEYMENLEKLKSTIPIYAIDGNHEWFPMVKNWTTVTEVVPNVFYVPRGTVLNIDGKKVAFCGGAASVDKKWQQQDGHWFVDELITDADIAKLDGVNEVDILVTHCPPQSVIQANFDPITLLYFDLPITWRDPSADKIEALWSRLNYPTLICGHMHKTVVDRSCTILNIAQLYVK